MMGVIMVALMYVEVIVMLVVMLVVVMGVAIVVMLCSMVVNSDCHYVTCAYEIVNHSKIMFHSLQRSER